MVIIFLCKNKILILRLYEKEIVSVGESVVLAEELSNISVFALDSDGKFLAIALENGDVWILKLTWNDLEKSSIKGNTLFDKLQS